MSLQDVFYLTNIIFMSLLIIIMIGMVVILFYIWKKIGELSNSLNEKINAVGRITANAEEVASSVTQVATGAMRRVSSIIGRPKEK